jgi:hypothetical protein
MGTSGHRVRRDGGRLRPKGKACPPTARPYNPPMLDIKIIREQPDTVRRRLASRQAGDEKQVDEVLSLDEARR